MIETVIHTIFIASLTSAYLASLLILFRKEIMKWIGAKWSYYLWFTIFIPWFVVWLPINIFPDNDMTFCSLPTLTFSLNKFHQIGLIQLSSLPTILAAIWLIGASVVSGYFVWTHVTFSGHLKNNALALSIKQKTMTKNNLLNKDQISLSRIYLSQYIHSPMICHIFQSKIYLPHDFYDLFSLHEQKYILQHECIHYQRCDLIANTGMLLLISMNWFNPVIIFSYRYFRITQELSCDAILSSQFSTAEKISYGETLLKSVLEKPWHASRMSCRWNSHTFLKERLIMLKSHTSKPLKNLFGVILLTMFASIAIFAPGFGKIDDSLDLKISNATDKILSFSVNQQCSEKRDLMNARSVKAIRYKQLKNSCRNNLSHCEINLFPEKNCTGSPFTLIELDLILGSSSVTGLSKDYRLGLYGNALFIDHSHV